MIRTSSGATPARPRRRRPFRVGFVVGAALVVPGIFVALLVPFAERLWPFLTPGAALLRPLSDVMATWPGGASLLLAAALNGLVVGSVCALTALLVRRRQ